MLARAPASSNRPRRAVARASSVTAPVGGWDAISALASMPPDRAVQLKNWFPQPGYVEVRKGHKYHAWDMGASVKTVTADAATDTLTSTAHGLTDTTAVRIYATTSVPAGLSAANKYYVRDAAANTFKLAATSGGTAIDLTSAGSGTIYVWPIANTAVESLMVWQGPSSSKLFAATSGAIWDVTSSQVATPALTGLGSSRWQHSMHTTSAGAFLFVVNGSDAARHYNGSVWATPAITGITASDIAHVCVHKKRLWFTMINSTKAAYLATESIAGAATEFQLGGQFSRGGYLVGMTTWTRDGGAGADDFAVFISSRGQLAIYAGTDPASATTWALVGVFDVPTPIGRRCFTRFGGDVLLLTLEGVYPLSQLLAVDQSQAGRVAISENIAPAFNIAARSYSGNHGWEACVYAKGTRIIVNVPTAESATAAQFVMNTLTGAWCEFDAHAANAWAVYNDSVYFAGPDGSVYQADTGSTDVDLAITAIGQTAYQDFGLPNVKRFTLLKPLLTIEDSSRPSLGISVDFSETSDLSAATAATAAAGSALWDTAVWDTFTWGGGSVQSNEWVSVPAIGTWASIKFQAQTGAASGGALWGVSSWGDARWGGAGRANVTFRINGFLGLAEPGGYL